MLPFATYFTYVFPVYYKKCLYITQTVPKIGEKIVQILIRTISLNIWDRLQSNIWEISQNFIFCHILEHLTDASDRIVQQGKAPVDIVNIRRIRSLRCGGKQFKLLSVELQPLDKNQCVSDAVCCYGAKNKTPTRLLFKKFIEYKKIYILLLTGHFTI